MLRKDYIMKMIEDFIRVIAVVIMKREMKNYADAKDELDNLSKQISGLGIHHLRALGAQGIVYLFGINKESFTEKIHCAANILKEDAMILVAEGKTEDSSNSQKIAEELFEMISDKEFDAKEFLKETEFN